MFGSLHTRSHFSFLDGASSPEELVLAASQRGHTALVLTDLYGVYGAVRVERACSRHNIKSIMGCDIVLDGIAVSLIARSHVGYQQICCVLTHHHQQDDVQMLLNESNCNDCIIIVHGTGHDLLHVRGVVDTIHHPHVYIGIAHDARPWSRRRTARLVDLAHDMQRPIVVAQDVRYATPDAYAVHDLMVCIREGITMFDPHPERAVHDKHALWSEDDLRIVIPYDEAFSNLSSILAQCTFSILPEHITPPRARIPEGTTAIAVLHGLCAEMILRRYQGVRLTQAQAQVAHELDVIERLELADFFLVVHEIVCEARARGIRCSGRGSAANSIVSYLLGITAVCPLEHNLLFERFLHTGRKGTPDIDVDFDSDRRSEVITWMEHRFGIDHTAMTATLITYRMRMAIRDAAKALGWPEDIVRALSKSVPGWTSKDVYSYRNDLARVCGDVPMLDLLLRCVDALLGHPRHLGLHSGGMILSSRPLSHYTPVQRSANGVAVVQFDKDDVEAMGLVKFDVLGLRMLACISECIELIRTHHGSTIDLDTIPLDDQATFERIRRGETLGVFQIESQGQMHLLAKHQPETFNDLIIEVALFRPGPLQGGMVHPYIARRRGTEPITYMHPDLEPILKDTLGIILFQEQVLEIAHRFAGMPLDQADDFRALVSKNRDREMMEHMRSSFINGAVARGVDPVTAEIVYEKVSHFVGYGFCRSHAAAFAKTVYQSAWLKTHHPAAYMAAFMQHRPGMYNLMTLEEEARRCDVAVLMPCLQNSSFRYGLTVDSEGVVAIQKPLTAIRGVEPDTARAIIWERSLRPFADVNDIVDRLSFLPRDILDTIALSGALDRWEPDTRRALWMVGVIKQRKTSSVPTLLDIPHVHEDDIPALPKVRAQERLAYDYISHGAARVHPMTLYRRTLIDLEVRTIEVLCRLPQSSSGTVTTAGIVILRQAPPTARGMLFVTLEDETGFLQCAVPPHVRQHFREELRNASLVVRGKLHAIGAWRSIMVEEVRVLNNMIGGYHGHLSYAGGRDTQELGVLPVPDESLFTNNG